MFDDLTAAFGLTVLCLAPIMLLALLFPPLFMRFSRPAPDPQTGEPSKRNPIGAALAFSRFYFVSLVIIVMMTIGFWWVFIIISGTDAAVDFAAQSLPVERDIVEEQVEPQTTPDGS